MQHLEKKRAVSTSPLNDTGKDLSRSKLSDGFVFPTMLLLLLVTAMFLSYYSTRFMLKLNTLENLENYYVKEMKEAISNKK
ncbi:hypothetical protein ROU88_04720 [Macrococcus capreoli]|uniref:hypothetical protein n=1 Tax=Macrococcus capreoli TaxID=2982690 RepID=UPI003EE44A35